MHNNTGSVAVLMGTIGVFLAVLGLAVGVPTKDASSHNPWYCYRLAPHFITSAVTPCTFPCLFISPNVHPHIVVQPELDGTPCHVEPSLHHKHQVGPSLHHKTEVGSCRRGVCTANLHPPVLKRKKRFVCLIALASLVKAKRERKRLQEQMEVLRRLTYMNSIRRVNSIGSGVGNANFPSRRTGGSGTADTADGSGTAVEIHVIPSGGNGGIVVDNSGREVPQPFNSGSGGGGSIHNAGFRNGVPGSGGVISDGSRGRRRGSSDLGNGNFVAPGRLDRNSESSVGRGAYGSGFAEARNFGIENSGLGRLSGGNSDLTAGIIGAGINGNGGRNLNDGNNAVASVSGIAATARTRTAGGGGSAAMVGVAGVRTTSRNGFGANDGTGRLTNTDPVMVNGGLVGVTGAFTSSGAGRRGRAGTSGIAPVNSLFGAESDDELGDNELDGPDEATINDERAVRSRSRGDAGFSG